MSDDLSDDLFPNFDTVLNLNEISKEESRKLETLTTLDEYLTLRDQISKELKEGFINIARANYVGTSLNKPYGKDYWDQRVKAIKKVEIVNDIVKLKEIEELHTEPIIKDEDVSIAIRNRRQGRTKSQTNKPKKYNPINMFGVLVPYQLKESQVSFNKALEQIVQLTNIAIKLRSFEDDDDKKAKEKKDVKGGHNDDDNNDKGTNNEQTVISRKTTSDESKTSKK